MGFRDCLRALYTGGDHISLHQDGACNEPGYILSCCYSEDPPDVAVFEIVDTKNQTEWIWLPQRSGTGSLLAGKGGAIPTCRDCMEPAGIRHAPSPVHHIHPLASVACRSETRWPQVHHVDSKVPGLSRIGPRRGPQVALCSHPSCAAS